jgi:hypothetical protein
MTTEKTIYVLQSKYPGNENWIDNGKDHNQEFILSEFQDLRDDNNPGDWRVIKRTINETVIAEYKQEVKP